MISILELENISQIETPEVCIPVFEHASVLCGWSSSFQKDEVVSGGPLLFS